MVEKVMGWGEGDGDGGRVMGLWEGDGGGGRVMGVVGG